MKAKAIIVLILSQATANFVPESFDMEITETEIQRSFIWRTVIKNKKKKSYNTEYSSDN